MFRLANGAWGLSIGNPLTYIDRVPADPGRERFLSTKEVRIILEEAKNTKNIKKFYRGFSIFTSTFTNHPYEGGERVTTLLEIGYPDDQLGNHLDHSLGFRCFRLFI